MALAVALAAAAPDAAAQSRRRAATLRVEGAEPRAIVFVDGIRFGRADEAGARTIATLAPGRREVLVRQPGFADVRRTVTLAAGRASVVRPGKTRLTDEAELAFQRADDLAYSGKHGEAVPLYERAVAERGGRYPAAQIGLARSLLAIKQHDRAAAAINALLEAEPRNVEAVTVSANILRDRGFYDDAAAAYRKAIDLAPSRAPEAYTGLAIVLEQNNDHAGAAESYRKAIAQNGDAEPILYQLLGASLEQADRVEEAIRAYERYLELAPDGTLAPAVRSTIEQLRAAAEEGDEDAGDVNPFAKP